MAGKPHPMLSFETRNENQADLPNSARRRARNETSARTRATAKICFIRWALRDSIPCLDGNSYPCLSLSLSPATHAAAGSLVLVGVGAADVAPEQYRTNSLMQGQIDTCRRLSSSSQTTSIFMPGTLHWNGHPDTC